MHSFPWTMALLIVLFLFPFLHPVPQIVLIMCLIAAEAFKWLCKKRDSLATLGQHTSPSLPLISIGALFIWTSYFVVFGSSIQRIFNWITGEVPVIARAGELQTVLERGFWDSIELAFKMYGQNIILTILSFFAAILIIRAFSQRRSEFNNQFYLLIILLVSGLTYLAISLAIGLVTWGRILSANFGLWGAPVLVGFVLYGLLGNSRVPKSIGIFIIVIFLTSTSILSIFSIYRSPWILQSNWQITYADISGANWISEYREPEMPVTEMGWIQAYPQVDIQEHFGYLDYETLGESIDKDTYLILTERFKQASVDPVLFEKGMISPPIIARPGFNEVDFAQIEIDQSVDKLYSNGEFEVFFAKSSGEE